MITQGLTNHDMQYEFKQPLFDNRQKRFKLYIRSEARCLTITKFSS